LSQAQGSSDCQDIDKPRALAGYAETGVRPAPQPRCGVSQKLVGRGLGKKRAPNPKCRRSIDGGNAPAVLRIRLIVRMRDLRTRLAIADGRDPGRRDAERDEDVLHGLSPAFAERQIVLACAALVAMALDCDADIAIALQPVGLALQDLPAFGGNLRAV